jgi:hypothetical protein
MSKPVYDTFAAKGNHDCDVAKRWKAYGVDSSFEEETKTLAIKLPEGWVNTMTEEQHKATAAAWCIDDPMLDVVYEMHIGRGGEDCRIDKLLAIQLDHEGAIEFSTPTGICNGVPQWHFVEDALPGTTLDIQLVAKVKVANKKAPIRTLNLVQGTLTIPAEPVALGNNTAGIFVVVAGGFALFAHYEVGSPGRITHFAFMGNMAGFEREFEI